MRGLLRVVATGLLGALLVSIGPLVLVGVTLVGRAGDPAMLTQTAVRAGATAALRTHSLEGFASHMSQEAGSSAAEIMAVMDRHVTQAWLDRQLLSLAGDLSAWLEEGGEIPSLTVDLAPVKRSVLEDPEAVDLLLLFARAAEEEMGPVADELTPEAILEMVPDRVVIVPEADPDRATELRRTADNIRRARAGAGLALAVPIGLLIGMLLLARAGRARLRRLAIGLALMAIPSVAIVLVLPEAAVWGLTRAMPGLPSHLITAAGDFLRELFAVPTWAYMALLGESAILVALSLAAPEPLDQTSPGGASPHSGYHGTDRARRGARGALYPKSSTGGAEFPARGRIGSRAEFRARGVEGRVLRGGAPQTGSGPEGSSPKR